MGGDKADRQPVIGSRIAADETELLDPIAACVPGKVRKSSGTDRAAPEPPGQRHHLGSDRAVTEGIFGLRATRSA